MSQTKESKDTKDAKGGGKPRVYQVANDLNLDTKTVLEFCKELGYTTVKSQLSALEADQITALKDRAKKGGPKAVAPPPPPKPTGPPKLPDAKIPTLTKPKTLPAAPRPVAPPPPAAEAPPAAPTPVQPVAELPPTPAAPEPVAPAPIEPPAVVAAAPVVETPPAPVVTIPEPPAAEAQPETPAAPEPSEPEAPAPVVPQAPRVPVLPTRPPVLPGRPPTLGGRPQTLPPRPPVPTPGAPRPVAPAAPQAPAAGPRPAGGSAPGAPANPVAPRSHFPPPQPGAPRPPLGSGPGGPRPGGPGGMPPRQGGPGMSAQRAGGLPPRHAGPGGGPGGPRPGGPGGPLPPRPAAGAPGAPKSVKLTPDQILKLRQQEQSRGQRVTVDQMQKQINAPQPPASDPNRPGGPAPGPHGRPGRGREDGEGGGDDDKKKAGGGPGGPGAVAGRDARHKARQDKGRHQGPGNFGRGAVVISGGQVDLIEQQSGSRRGPRAALLRKMMRGKQKVQTKKEGRIEIALPITVRTLSETIGMKSGELLLKLKNLTNSLYTINSNIEFEVAEMIAIDRGVELVAKKQETAEDIMYARLKKRAEESDPANLTTRPPVVTIMGHVDHGKTSLLDKIRQEYGLTSDVVSTEAGGITQVLRAWRVEKDGKSTTFLDTPGHEAFTKMRARGADVTDIVVIVVSASDGVMPQTEEAISHARAAEVDIIVAINKVDLPDANIERTRRQLYQLNLLPDNMGGEVPFVECSAKTGQGIGELLDNIATLAEFAELKADPTLAGSGTCLEAYLEGDRGVMATLLVENGTLRKGDIVLCGASFGRVRAMYDDHGRPAEEAGPSTPVKFTGLDAVPDADDEFLVVDDIGTAREIAEARKEAKQQAALAKFSPVSLDSLKAANAKTKITELKVILKAEARGSVEAIKKELEKLVHEEVAVRVLHAGIGAITESDVTLALTSPENTMIVGFNVTADDAALALAEARGIQLREYQIIYNLVDDVKAALEGRLKPVEEVVHLGRAIVRATFKVSKVGTIAGCFVTSGTIERNAKVRVIRDGTVLFPPAERTVGLDSLKRFKDDAKEVREGFECGMKVAGFDDIKVGDVIEAYRIEIRQRTL